ncbi:MAG: Gfo/Idh/MocA family oxidoreductase [Phycisphaerae bacterium]|nr:Gfo/Idh/MocA family oxidoreductase [Phycisphaerae bacterium]
MAAEQGQLTRRGFLSAAAAAVTLPQFIPASALGKGDKAAPSERITFGVIGLGDRGPRHCKMGGAEGQLVAACDTWKDRREKIAAQYKVKPYADFREVLARKDVDAIVITTPDHWHVPLAILAAKAGKDIFCEKALGISVEQDLALRAVLKRYKTVFQYGPQRRASHKFRHACELARNGRIGEIKEIHIVTMTFGACAPKKIAVQPPPETLDYEMWMGPSRKVPYVPGRCKSRGWYTIYDHSIGWIAAWGSHVLSIAQWGYDIHKAGITEYQGTGVIPNEGLNDNLIKWDVKMQCANGVKMTLKTGGNSVKFVGTEGSVWAADRGQGSDPESLWKDAIKPGEKRLKSANLGTDFIKCVKTRAATVGPIDDAVYSDIMSHIADIAIRLKRPVKWDPAKEVIVGDAEATKMLSRPIRSPWEI